MSWFRSTNQERSYCKDPATWEDGKSRLQQTQEEVEQVKDIMTDNMEKADERSGKLNDLEQQAEDLLEKSKVFEKTTRTLKQQKEISNKNKCGGRTHHFGTCHRCYCKICNIA
ncbi:vesicle-associated membrane protein 5-like isoform X1 [Xiphophorus hellerii]|uniref:vesicle-associated membrane protein 5-like isoform X1 n=1 Tax=Xiphophorus hellerii TaxID=8084 RepID=UPI0013B46360|nr:vesicle-associated membrane protein 5-like isoform X1 [Xiphophorus hellerii]